MDLEIARNNYLFIIQIAFKSISKGNKNFKQNIGKNNYHSRTFFNKLKKKLIQKFEIKL